MCWTTDCTAAISPGPTVVNVVHRNTIDPFSPSFSPWRVGQDDGRQRSSMLSSPTPSHYFISLLLNPSLSRLVSIPPRCLVLTERNCASEIYCVSQYFGTLRFAYTLHWGFADCGKGGSKQPQWVQGNEDGTHLKYSPQWTMCAEPGDFSAVTVAGSHWPAWLCVHSRGTSGAILQS